MNVQYVYISKIVDCDCTISSPFFALYLLYIYFFNFFFFFISLSPNLFCGSLFFTIHLIFIFCSSLICYVQYLLWIESIIWWNITISSSFFYNNNTHKHTLNHLCDTETANKQTNKQLEHVRGTNLPIGTYIICIHWRLIKYCLFFRQ